MVKPNSLQHHFLYHPQANFGILEVFLTELLKFDFKIEEVLESEANQETEDDKFNVTNHPLAIIKTKKEYF
jgi:hypothetical protein